MNEKTTIAILKAMWFLVLMGIFVAVSLIAGGFFYLLGAFFGGLAVQIIVGVVFGVGCGALVVSFIIGLKRLLWD